MEKRWTLKAQGDKEKVDALAKELGVSNNIANLLIQREICNYEEAKAFFRPQLSDLHDPFLLKDMEKAIERIKTAIDSKEKILIYGDYDVDGTSAVALVYTYFKRFTDNIEFYIPDRYLEGYGISMQSIDFADENGFSLVISLDCGIKAVEKIDYANSKGIDFIICDHHRPGSELPKAHAVLDPKREDCTYPYEELSGCGVGFKLIQAYSQKHNLPFDELIKYLDLVAISIASDIVDITGENRTLAYYGLKKINSSPRPGIEAILQYSGIKRKETLGLDNLIFARELNVNDLVFLVGPRINAAGRMESGRNSVEILISENMIDAALIGEDIDTYNSERRNLDSSTTIEAIELIQNDEFLSKSKSTVIYKQGWHKGVIGIVASRLIETFYRPTIVFTYSDGLICGSARSVKDFDIYNAIDACSDLLEHFGGHKFAAGLSLKEENFEAFRKRFETIVSQNIEENMLTPEIEIDAVLKLNEINSKFYRLLKQFAPFGPGNMSPVFQTDSVVDDGQARVVGKNHLKLSIIHPEISSYPIPAIAFQQGIHYDKIKSGIPFSICYHIEENEWNGNTTLQLNIKDIRF
jgi:single-stranded-DNA-specific exonuclease